MKSKGVMKDVSDVFIWVAECLNEYELKSVYNWRVVKKYADDFCNDNNIELVVKRK